MTEPYDRNSGFKSFSHGETYDELLVDGRTVPPTINHNIRNSGPFVHSTFQPSSVGYKNPMWRDQVAHLQNATTTYVGVDCSEDPAPYTSATQGVCYRRQSDNAIVYQLNQAQWFSTAAVSPPAYLDPPGSVVTDVTNRCIRKFLQAVDSAQSSFEAGQDLGEWKQTLESVHHPLNSLKTSILNYFSVLKKRRGKYNRNPIALKKVLADTYLEFHFGWQPLVADVASAIADIGRFRFPAVPVVATAHLDYDSKGVTVYGGYNSSIVHSHSYRETSRYEVRYKGMLRPKNLGSDGRLSLAQSLQLTPDKWLPTAWDLLPYSWMSDYFVNIGEIISGVSAALSVDLAWGVVTNRHRITRSYLDVQCNMPYVPVPGYDTVWIVNSSYGGTCQTWSKKVIRQPRVGSDLIPTLQFSLPGSRYPFFNMGAILLQKSGPLVPFFR